MNSPEFPSLDDVYCIYGQDRVSSVYAWTSLIRTLYLIFPYITSFSSVYAALLNNEEFLDTNLTVVNLKYRVNLQKDIHLDKNPAFKD